MEKFFGKIQQSKTALLVHSITLGFLFFAIRFFFETIHAGYYYINGIEKYLSYNPYGYYLTRIQNLVWVLLFLQFFALLIISVLASKLGVKQEKSALIESFINSFSGLNLAVIILLFVSISKNSLMNYNLFRGLLILSQFAVFISSYLTLKESDDEEDPYSPKLPVKKIKTLITGFQFPYRRSIGLPLYFIGLVISYYIQKNPISFYLTPISILVSAFGVIYLLMGKYHDYKSKDELEKRIILEHSFVMNLLMIGTILFTFMLSVYFKIRINAVSTIGIFAPVLLISELFIKNKYE